MLGEVMYLRTECLQVGVETSASVNGAVKNKLYGDVSGRMYAHVGTSRMID